MVYPIPFPPRALIPFVYTLHNTYIYKYTYKRTNTVVDKEILGAI